jgi:predicted amidophosphoribosyltransferase
MEAQRQSRYCPECGRENPRAARYCMDCAYPLAGVPAPNWSRDSGLATGQRGDAAREPALSEAWGPDRGLISATPLSQSKTDWATIIAAVLAALSLQNMSRKARQTTIAIVLLVLLFGCPMACGFLMFVMEWIARLLGG